MKDKLDSVLKRLGAQLYSEDDGGGPWDENWYDQRTELFEYVTRINPNPPSCRFFPSTLRLIRVKGNALCDRIKTQGHEECQGDIQAVSEIAEDIRDALLDYQVGGDKSYVDVRSLKLKHFDRCASNGQYLIRTAG